MATIAQQQDDENENNKNGSTVSVAGTGGASSSGGTGQGGAAAPISPVQQNTAPQNNNGYTDVASYLNANQGGSQQLGQQVSQNLSNKYDTTKQGVTDSANSFNQSVNSGYVPENTDLINQVAANPTAAAADPTQLSAFSGQLNDTYTGPTSWADQGTQQGNVDTANEYASLANTPGGLNIYTGEVEGANGGPQSQGINQLDTLLLGGNEGAIGQVQTAANKYSDLNDYINQMNTTGLNNVTNAQNSATQTSNDALNAFTGANGTLTNLNNTVNANANTALSSAQAQQAALQADLGKIYSQPVDNSSTTIGGYNGSQTPWYNSTNYAVNNSLSPQDLQELGISSDQWNALQTALQSAGTSQYMTGHNFGAASPTSQIDLSQFLNLQDPSQGITAATTATPEQYAQMAAIQQLLGSKTPQGTVLNPANASQAGTAPTSSASFNYQNALDYANQVAQQERQAGQDEANQLTGQADQAHADSQHGGFLSKLGNLATLLNPVSYLGSKGIVDQQLKNFNTAKKLI